MFIAVHGRMVGSPYVSNVYFVVTHLTLCCVGPLVVIALCYALICRTIWHRQIPGNDAIDTEQRPTMCHNNLHQHQPYRRRARCHRVDGRLNLQRAKIRALRMLAVVVAAFTLS